MTEHTGSSSRYVTDVTMDGHGEEEEKEEEQPVEDEDIEQPSSTSEKQPKQQPEKQSIMDAAKSEALRPFVIISSSYLLFTITDGALRMIVLLHAYNKNFSALEVAIMFTLYELAGVFTNLAAGFMGAKWGIKVTLISGLTLQLLAYGLLFGWQDDWPKSTAIVYVTIAQMFAGIAKDLTKLGGKTVTKLVTPEEQETKLFKLVSLITGWKNSLKGVGYFLGSALVQVSYELALAVMMILVALAMPWAICGLDRSLGTAKKSNAKWSDVFNLKNRNLNILSLARLFLFASRDFWFEVPLPFFLRSPSCEGLGTDECTSNSDCGNGAECSDDMFGVCQNINTGGGCGGLGMARVAVGAFLGGYIILYGQVQSWTPQLVTGPLKQTPPNKLTEVLWNLINCLPTLIMTFVLAFAPAFENYDLPAMTAAMVISIVAFAIIFAVNSSIHSFLVVKYASTDKIAVSVGFYYMSNAMGRLFGTLGSGILYTYVGEDFGPYAGNDAVAALAACFLAGTLSSLTAAVITIRIEDQDSGLNCGGCTLVEGKVQDDEEMQVLPERFPVTMVKNVETMPPTDDKSNRPYQLVVVESKEKCDTLSKLLENNFGEDEMSHDILVASCQGLVRDLSMNVSGEIENSMVVGVNVENDYEPIYEILPGKEKLVKELGTLALGAQQVVLATDEGREGEAMAWHLVQLLPKEIKHVRVTYAEISVNALRNAVKNAHPLDLNLVEAEETRRILNRLGDCTVSPIVRRKIAPDLSAAREETLGMELIVQRERERLAFASSQYMGMRAAFFDGVDVALEAALIAVNGITLAVESDFDEKGTLKHSKRLVLTAEGADELISSLSGEVDSLELRDLNLSKWTVTSVETVEISQSPPMPFTTSTLYEEATKRLDMSLSHIMKIAKDLYESGYITYMNTDSVHMDEDTHWATAREVRQLYGSEMIAPPRKAAHKNARDIEQPKEAIRPALQPIGTYLKPDELEAVDSSAARLYELIYKRTVASRMSPLVVNEIKLQITGTSLDKANTVLFQACGSVVVHPGYTSAWEDSAADSIIPQLDRGQTLKCTNLVAVPHTTQPPPRYTEATFAKEMEAKGLAQSGTYVSTIQALCDRGYIREHFDATDADEEDAGNVESTSAAQGDTPMVPSLSAFVVCSFLEKNCPNYVDIAFNAEMQRRLDEIALGNASGENRKVTFLDDIYTGESGLAAQMSQIADNVSPDDARKANIPEVFLNKSANGQDIGLFRGPEGPYVQKVPKGGMDSSERPISAPLPPTMAADVATINPTALRAWLATMEPGGLVLGQHPDDGRVIRLKVGIRGAYLVWGEDGEEETTTHPLPPHIGGIRSIEDENMDHTEDPEVSFDAVTRLTLEDAIRYLPRTVCKLKGKKIVAAVGPYGPYLKYKKSYVKLDEKVDIASLDADIARRIVKEKIVKKSAEEDAGVIAELGEKEGSIVRIRTGRQAMRYVTWKEMKARLPDEFQNKPEDFSLAQAWALLQKKKAASFRKTVRKTQSLRDAQRLSRRSRTPSKLRKPKSAYLHFCDEKKPEITKTVMSEKKEPSTKSHAQISKELARQWEELGADGGVGRRKYEIRAAADQARYKDEMNSPIPVVIETNIPAPKPQSVPEEKKDA